ncbi:MAG: hypothetical protein ACM690_03720, partial [Phascolarctobacterium sp.]|uniref:hypothetical protein n=1 Tax=Phascolarctobacterium sp. TaxID=2049039 RepID=UPI003A1023FF
TTAYCIQFVAVISNIDIIPQTACHVNTIFNFFLQKFKLNPKTAFERKRHSFEPYHLAPAADFIRRINA